MFRNYLTTALRNLAHNKLYAGINIIGLAVGFAAAILIALFIRYELNYDRFLPDYERIYRVYSMFGLPQSPVNEINGSLAQVSDWLKLKLPGVERIARISFADEHSIRRGEHEAVEEVHWADPTLFEIFRLPTVAGDLQTALARPDGVVITREIARKYFGRDDPIGEVLELDRKHSLRIAAVLDDLPANTTFDARIVASALAPFSQIASYDARSTGGQQDFATWIPIYIKVAPNSSFETLVRSLPEAIKARPELTTLGGAKVRLELKLLPIADVHRHVPAANGVFNSAPGLNSLYALAAIGSLIVFAAAINFVNLMTARTEQRAIEIGIRKVSGAARRDLIAQFIGESVLSAICGLVLALAVVELCLPPLNGFLGRTLSLDYARSPEILLQILAAALIVGVLAGTYPAFVLAGVRPISAFKGKIPTTATAVGVRQLLVVFQFAILIGLLLATGILYRQTRFAMNEGLRLNKERVVLIDTGCSAVFKDEVRALAGVQAAACSGAAPLKIETGTGGMRPGEKLVNFKAAAVDASFFDLYGLQPLAGRFFDMQHGSDTDQSDASQSQSAIVINETLSRSFGFDSPSAAIGQAIAWVRPISQGGKIKLARGEIIGVVPDFVIGSVDQPIPSTAFYNDPSRYTLMNIKLDGQAIPESLHAIGELWKRLGEPHPIKLSFFDLRTRILYADTIQMQALLSAFATVAVVVACLGMFGLSVFIAKKRTKEIGIRKAMGAGTQEVMRLLIWQFTKPVLWANLIAWPLAAFVMNRWLQGFAYHIDLSPWLFIGATTVALAIALLTVSVHCYLVARAKPITALRYE